jgi:hypothetical protein
LIQMTYFSSSTNKKFLINPISVFQSLKCFWMRWLCVTWEANSSHFLSWNMTGDKMAQWCRP